MRKDNIVKAIASLEYLVCSGEFTSSEWSIENEVNKRTVKQIISLLKNKI